MQTGITFDTKQFLADLDDVATKQAPFAMSLALNATAKTIQKDLTNALPVYFVKPTPFTMKAFGVSNSRKNNLKAVVFVKAIQEKYLKYGIEGGSKSPDGKAHLLPATIRLNKYGNIPSKRGGRKVEMLLAKPNVFQGVVRGQAGIWQRSKRGKLKLLLAFNSRPVKYKKRFPFKRIAESTGKREIEKNLKVAMTKALKTMRR
jgi:hypothetical protein